MNLTEYLRRQSEIVDEALERLLPGASESPAVVHEAIRYSTLNGGKRIRPILALAASDAVGGKVEATLPAACAIECIHSFSLIHDDLPCMDNDDFRRGRPTTHRAFDEATALLAADGLIALAFEIVAGTPGVPASVVVEVSRLIARATGTRGMVGGQILDMQAQGRDVDLSEVEEIHRRKTGALLETAVVIGGMLGGGSEEQVSALSRYGRKIGLAFQIADDILDLQGDPEKLGKTVGSDLRMQKSTYPSIIGIEKSRQMAEDAIDDALAALTIFDERADPLRHIARYIIERET